MHRKIYRMRTQPFADVCCAALCRAESEEAPRIFADEEPGVLDLLQDNKPRAAFQL
ncbi:hypothetical protein [Streptomyces sp. NPDC003023]|uniref:hypothetical protein n=1 Tax=Streptomyces sp. NPDC003023 TaxID=3364675 RepID=UPI0036990351